MSYQFSGIFLGNDSQDRTADGQSFFYLKADKSSHSKTGPVSEIASPIIEILHDDPDGHKPDDDLEETDDRSAIF
jgi:hypothetical protein